MLSDDESLPVKTTTHDPGAERLEALEKATGFGKLVDAEIFMGSVLQGRDADVSLLEFRRSLGG